eukprot:scaffold219866_cov28-Tisochrysis_lutea.AAC.1
MAGPTSDLARAPEPTSDLPTWTWPGTEFRAQSFEFRSFKPKPILISLFRYFILIFRFEFSMRIRGVRCEVGATFKFKFRASIELRGRRRSRGGPRARRRRAARGPWAQATTGQEDAT